MKANIYISIFLFLIFCPSLIFCTGTSTAVVLRQDIFAHSSALGESFTAFEGGIPSLSYNPAGIIGLKRNNIHASYSTKLIDSQLGFAGYGYGTDSYAFVLGVTYLDTGKETFKFSDGTSYSRTALQENIIQLGYSKRLSELFSLGVLAKNFSSTIVEEYNASKLLFDAGVIYKGLFQGASLAASLRNIGGSITYVNQEDKLPQQTRFGFVYTYAYSKVTRFYERKEIAISLLADFVETIEEGTETHLGIDMDFGTYAFRIGNKIGVSNENFTAGISLNEGRGIKIDYAIGLRSELDLIHVVSLNIGW